MKENIETNTKSDLGIKEKQEEKKDGYDCGLEFDLKNMAYHESMENFLNPRSRHTTHDHLGACVCVFTHAS